jgi:hypothetical protein
VRHFTKGEVAVAEAWAINGGFSRVSTRRSHGQTAGQPRLGGARFAVLRGRVADDASRAACDPIETPPRFPPLGCDYIMTAFVCRARRAPDEILASHRAALHYIAATLILAGEFSAEPH